MSEIHTNGKCSKCATEIIKIVDADKSFRADKTRYIYKDESHIKNVDSIVYDIFRCRECLNVIDESWIKNQDENLFNHKGN